MELLFTIILEIRFIETVC